MAQINPYIHFNGNAEEAFKFYQSVLGGSVVKIMRYKDLSGAGYPIPHDDANKLMHISLAIGKNSVLMGSDVMEAMGRVTEGDNRNAISITAESQEEADKLFSGLSNGGKIEMPPAFGPFGAYFGMFTDKYGVQWTLSFDPADKVTN